MSEWTFAQKAIFHLATGTVFAAVAAVQLAQDRRAAAAA
jgi:hypothetical protein